ncbi:hypothetical protein AKJ16_DCAP15737 [Drosera capensis]
MHREKVVPALIALNLHTFGRCSGVTAFQQCAISGVRIAPQSP